MDGAAGGTLPRAAETAELQNLLELGAPCPPHPESSAGPGASSSVSWVRADGGRHGCTHGPTGSQPADDHRATRKGARGRSDH